MPVRRDRAISFTLPEITTTTDLPKATNALLQAVASGELTPSGAPTHVIADYSIEDEEADDALANWRVRVAHGSASALDGVLYLTEGLEMSESDWIAQHVTEH